MARRDLSSSIGAAPPLPPLGPGALSPEHLTNLGRRVAARTWELGLPRWFWGEGVALLGLGTFGQATGSGDDQRVRDWVDVHLHDGLWIEHVNDLAPGTAAIAVDLTGAYLEALRPLVTWAFSEGAATRADNGAIEHWPGGVWADTMFMVGAFLARYGHAAKDDAIVEEAGRQLVLHAELLQDETTGLFAHGRHRDETIWSFWGRANAWAALAAVEFLEQSAEIIHRPLRDEIRDRLMRQLNGLARLQPEHGVWDVLVDSPPETKGILETSAAAGIAAAMLRSTRVIDAVPPSIAEAGRLAARGALAYVDEGGTLTRVSAGTVLQLKSFGYGVIRDDRPQPWGQGLALTAIVAALDDAARIGGEG